MCATERRLIAGLHNIRTTTGRLAAKVRSLNPTARVYTIPNALDPSLFPFNPEDRKSGPTLGFVASMNWSPGRLAAERLITRIFPKVVAKRPDARVLLAGWNAREALGKHLAIPGVEIASNVP